MQKTFRSTGDQPRATAGDISRADAAPSLQYRVSSIKSLGDNRSMRPMRREGRG